MAKYYMNATVKEWLAKAEKDFATARRELRVYEDPNFDAVCFHAQQTIEKLMKGLLIHLGAAPTKTHDLAFLSRLLAAVCPAWSWPHEELRFLSRAAVAFRYPGEAAELDDAAEAFAIASHLRQKLLEFFREQSQK